MNIKGVLLLNRMGLPHGFIHFKDFSEIENLISSFPKGNILFIMGSDDRIKINAHPYEIKKWRRIHICREQIKSSLQELNLEMDRDKIPILNRIFSFGKCFNNFNVVFTGHAFKRNNEICVDIKKGLRNSGTDFTPDFSFIIHFTNERILFSEIPSFEFRDYIVQICKDILIIEGNAYLDFALMEDGEFIYHDLSIHK